MRKMSVRNGDRTEKLLAENITTCRINKLITMIFDDDVFAKNIFLEDMPSRTQRYMIWY